MVTIKDVKVKDIGKDAKPIVADLVIDDNGKMKFINKREGKKDKEGDK